MNTLLVASEGYLVCANPLPIAVDGYLNNCDGGVIPQPPEPEVPRPGGGGGYGSKSKRLGDKDFFLKQEDEEIMIIIKAFIKCQ